MHSFIVTNWNLNPASLPLLVDFPSLHHPDVLLVEPDPSITIAQIRDLKTWLARKPYQAKTKLALLLQAHTLTLPAQHALLKSLEEPPPDSIIILATNQPDSLIPTIHSRCQLINLARQEVRPLDEVGPLWQQVSQVGVGGRLNLAAQFSTKDQALSFCLNAIYYYHDHLKTDPSVAPRLRLLQTTHAYLKANISPKLAMENLFLLL